MRFEPPARLVDWSILVGLVIAGGTGVASLFAGRPTDAWVFTLHGVTGFLVVVLLAWKFRRIAPRLRPSQWAKPTIVSVSVAVVAIATLATGIYWVVDEFAILGWSGLVIHAILGIILVGGVAIHLAHRFRPPRRTDFAGRRTAFQYALLVGGGVIAWRVQQAVLAAAGVTRRFTGSRERGIEPGNTFPVTSWVADDPDPIDPETWELTVTGSVTEPITLDYTELTANDTVDATLDCTGGWYTEQSWQGIRVGRLLDRVDPNPDARWVRFRSTTGYRWNLPIEEARDALLATHVGDTPLSHGHGFPLRLVAPGRRGFQWVKWVDEVSVRRHPDYDQWIAIFVSGF